MRMDPLPKSPKHRALAKEWGGPGFPDSPARRFGAAGGHSNHARQGPLVAPEGLRQLFAEIGASCQAIPMRRAHTRREGYSGQNIPIIYDTNTQQGLYAVVAQPPENKPAVDHGLTGPRMLPGWSGRRRRKRQRRVAAENL